jgi:predicted PurR-regulated permease PerM
VTRSSSTVGRTIALTTLAVIVVWALYLARQVLLLIYISMLLAIGFAPLVHAIEHQRVLSVGTRRLPRWLAILVVYLTIVAVLTLVGLLVIPPLIDQSQELWNRAPSLLESTQTFLLAHGLLNHRITLEEAVRAGPAPGNAVGTVATAVTSIVGGLFGFVTILILTFYLLTESESLSAGFARLFPRGERPRVETAARKISGKVSAWLSGQLILAGTIGVTAAFGLYLLGVPYFYVLALLAAIGEMVPVIGPVLSAVPAVLVALSVSPRTALFVLIFLVVQQQFENHFLVPKVMERQVGVSAVTVIIALLLGGSLLGILGAVLAVPTAAILQVLLLEMLDERDRLDERAHGIHE